MLTVYFCHITPSRKSVHSSVAAESSTIKTFTNKSYRLVKHTQDLEQDHFYEMVPMASPRAGAYCEVNIGHRPCLPLPISPPTSETTAEMKDLVYDIIPGQNK